MEIILIATIVGIAILNSIGIIMLLMRSKAVKTYGSDASVVVDTSGLIDGRILDIARAGFIPTNILLPHAVVGELQHLADLADPHKRERARFGLDVVKQLQALPHLNVHMIGDEVPGLLVDDQLVKIADNHGAALYTTDYNLNKVAAIKGVTVLNVNELAQSLRSSALPGENGQLKIIQKGQDSSQGVGYLPDGTMVVVEKAGSKIGQSVDVVFSRVLQTQAGKMMFAKLVSNEVSKQDQSSPQRRKSGNASKKQFSQTTRAKGSNMIAEPTVEKNPLQTRSEEPVLADPQATTTESAITDQPPKVVNTTNVSAPRTSRPRQNNNRRRKSPEDALLDAIKRLEQ